MLEQSDITVDQSRGCLDLGDRFGTLRSGTAAS
jgi:hypothetical protein